MKKSKKIETLSFELESFIDGNSHFYDRTTAIENELFTGEYSSEDIKNQRRIQLNRVWHATRALDSTMRMFLGYHHITPSGYSMGNYLSDLQNKSSVGHFHQLNGNLAQKMDQEIVYQRNRFAHVAGEYPTKGEANYLVGQIYEAMNTVLGLKLPS